MFRRSFSALPVCANVAVGVPIDCNFSFFPFSLSLQSPKNTGGSVFVEIAKNQTLKN